MRVLFYLSTDVPTLKDHHRHLLKRKPGILPTVEPSHTAVPFALQALYDGVHNAIGIPIHGDRLVVRQGQREGIGFASTER